MNKTLAYLGYKKKDELLGILKSSAKKENSTAKHYDDLRMLLENMDADALVRLLMKNISHDGGLKSMIQRELQSRQENIPDIKVILAQLHDWSELLPKDKEIKAKIRKLNQFLKFNPEIKFQFQKLFADASKGEMQEGELEYFTSKFSELAPQIWDAGNIKYLLINPVVLFFFLFILLSLAGSTITNSFLISGGAASAAFLLTLFIRFTFFENIFAQSDAKDDMTILGDILKTQNEFVKARKEADENLLPEEANPVSLDTALKRLADSDDSEPNLLTSLGKTSQEIQSRIESMLDL